MIRVEALASHGTWDRGGARAAARRFVDVHPGSPHADRVEWAAGVDEHEKGMVHRKELGE